MTDAGVETVEATFVEAICTAQEDAMAEDETIVLMGQDIVAGFPFGATKGLAQLYGPERVRNTPISEAGTMGCAVGAAMMGTRAVVEVDFAGFLFLGFDQLLNNGASLRYMSAGQIRVPLVVRVGHGPIGSFAAQHSRSLQGWLANTPGLAVCAPSSSQDAYDLFRWALRQNDPVVIAEDLRLYRQRGALRRRGAGESTALPGAAVVRQGRDASVITFGFGTTQAIAAAEQLADEGIELEILDLRMVAPIDEAAIEATVRHTGRVLCVSDEPLFGGIASSLAAIAAELGHPSLSAPVARLGTRHVPSPYASVLEELVHPSAGSIVEAVRRLVSWEQ
jgi:pyruvate/2-oxoglutarate/acetoin dehydrogenase E1 component